MRHISHLRILILFALLVIIGNGQTDTSTLRGTVFDQQGASTIQSALVTLKNTRKEFTRTQLTNVDGEYLFEAVPPDT